MKSRSVAAWRKSRHAFIVIAFLLLANAFVGLFTNPEAVLMDRLAGLENQDASSFVVVSQRETWDFLGQRFSREFRNDESGTYLTLTMVKRLHVFPWTVEHFISQ